MTPFDPGGLAGLGALWRNQSPVMRGDCRLDGYISFTSVNRLGALGLARSVALGLGLVCVYRPFWIIRPSIIEPITKRDGPDGGDAL